MIKSVINLITFLIMFGVGVEGIDTAAKIIRGEAIKSQKRGMISLQEWNSQLQKK